MSMVHLHLLLNHMTIFLLFIALLTCLLNLALWRSRTLSYYCVGLLVATAFITWPVYLTGEGSEDLVKTLIGVAPEYIENHEASAKLTLAAIQLTGLLSALYGWVLWKKHKAPKYLVILVLLITTATLGLASYTGYLGGQIRHTEIRPGGAI